MRSLVRSTAASSLLLLVACAKPAIKVDVCLVRGVPVGSEAQPVHTLVAGEAPVGPAVGCDCQKSDGTYYFLPLEECDKYVALPPPDAERVFKRLIECQKGGR